MKHIITCSNYKCKHNSGYNKCYLKVVAVDCNGCSSFILSNEYNPNIKVKKVHDVISEHTNMC